MYRGYMTLYRFSLFAEGKNPLMRAFRYLCCWCVQFWKGLHAKDIDLIYLASTPPIQGALGAILKRIKKIPFVYNLQDIFPDSLVGTGLVRNSGLIWKIGRVIEDFTYKHADKIIVISEDFKRNIMAKGVPEEKIVVVYNWVDQNVVKNIDRKDNKLFDRYHLNKNRFYITYSGNIGLTQNMDLLLDVAKGLEDNEEIQFVLIGEGAYKEQVKEIIDRDNIKNVTLLPFQPYEDISHVFSLGDVGIIISKPGVGENSVPSKTWSIMSASRPVLANFDENEIKTILSENECGVFTKAGDKQAFTDAILELCRNREMCRKYGENGRKFVMENLTREIGTQKYIDVIKSVAKG
ncbi:glycosyltransferase family 4 protein [Bacteroides thetaiotaomicron]